MVGDEEEDRSAGGDIRTSKAMVARLPISLLGHVIDYLSLADADIFLKFCNENSLLTFHFSDVEAFRTICCIEDDDDAIILQTQIWNFLISSLSSSHSQVRLPTTMIVQLDLQDHATDEMLSHLAAYTPALESVSLVGSNTITMDNGLSHLGNRINGGSSSVLKELRFIDLTFCRQITYENTLDLRGMLHHGDSVVIRRQPMWMDGESYPYIRYPDGSFERENPDLKWRPGYNSQLLPINNNPRLLHIERHYITVSDEYHELRESWWGHMLRKSNILLLQNDAVVDVERCQGLCPPDLSVLETLDLALVPLEVEAFFLQDGTRVLEGEQDFPQRYILVRREICRPLSTSSLSPPARVLEAHRTYFHNQSNFAFTLPRREMYFQMHANWGGSPDELHRFLPTVVEEEEGDFEEGEEEGDFEEEEEEGGVWTIVAVAAVAVVAITVCGFNSQG